MALKAIPPKRVKNPRKVIVTAGPTLEYIDPVRYISNRSTGTMGYSIAEECQKKGFSVCLISGPVCLEAPRGVEIVRVTSSREMLREVMKRSVSCDCLVMAAAVCDFRPAKTETRKIKKKNELDIKFTKNRDILGALRGRDDFVKIGFALETEKAIDNGTKKLKNKELDLIIVNKVGKTSNPFGKSVTDYVLIDKTGEKRIFEKTSKGKIARIISSEAKKLMERAFDEK